MYLTTNVLGEIGAMGAGHKCQQHSRGGVATTQIDSYSTLLASPHTSQLQQTLHRLQSHHLIHLTITAFYLHHHNNLTTVATNIPSVVTNSNTHYIGRNK